MENPFQYAQGKKVVIIEKQRKEIKKLYSEMLEEVRKDIRRVEHKKDISSSMRTKYLKGIESQIKEYMKNVDKKTETLIELNMKTMVSELVENNNMFIKKLGFNFYTGDKKIKENVVNRIITGKVYSNKFSLSSSIWGDNKKKLQEIHNVIAKGVAQNKSLFEISSNLERYVNPLARKKWSWDAMVPGSRRKIDYNAQRLARTMIQHAYQESFVAATKNNPFIDAYQWITSGSDKVCPICIDRETVDHYGLGPGIYPKDSLPLDHPNGMCIFDVVITMSEAEIYDAIADWYFDEGDDDMNNKIEKYVKEIKNF